MNLSPRNRLRAIGILMISTMCACMHYVRNLPPSTKFDPQSEDAIVVLKVEPTARVSIAPGTVDRSGWQLSTIAAAYAAWAEDGIIILKVKPRTGNETYGVTVVTPDDGKYASFYAKRGVSVPVFRASAGQVTFVGAIRIEQGDQADAVQVVHNNSPDDGEMVSRLVKRRYPQIRAKVVSQVFDLIPRNDNPSSNTSRFSPTPL